MQKRSFNSKKPGGRGFSGSKRMKGGKKGFGKPRRRLFIFKKRKCRFCMEDKPGINFEDHQFLRKFTTERGKIIPSRISGTCAKHQRKLAKAIKRARNAGLMPFLAG